MKAFKAFLNALEAPQRSENKNLNLIFSLRPGSGRERLKHISDRFQISPLILKLTSNGILHYLWSADLSKAFLSIDYVNIYFPQSIAFANIYLIPTFFFNRFCPIEKFRATPLCMYINFK